MRTAESIRNIRINLHMTQGEFGAALEIGQAIISQYETGLKTPSIKTAKRILELAKTKKIKVKLEDLFPDEQ